MWYNIFFGVMEICMVVRITDEFNTVWNFESESKEEVVKIVKDWLDSSEETPIYEIVIEIDPNGNVQ